MAELWEEIAALIDTSENDLGRIERTLTDGYAHALALEGERWRIQRRLAEVAQGLEAEDTGGKTRELSSLAKRLELTTGELTDLRGRLGALRRHADGVRVTAA